MLKIFTYGDYSLYSFDRLPAPTPFYSSILRGAYFANVDVTLACTIAPGWAIVGGGRITSGVATDANFGNSITGGGILALKKIFFQGAVDFTLGAAYVTRLSRPARFVPYLDFDVNVLPSFTKIPMDVLLLYNGGIVTYRISNQLSVMGEVRYDLRSYRLSTGAPVTKGVWSERGLDVGGGIGWTPAKKNWSINVLGGYRFLRNVEIFANNGMK